MSEEGEDLNWAAAKEPLCVSCVVVCECSAWRIFLLLQRVAIFHHFFVLPPQKSNVSSFDPVSAAAFFILPSIEQSRVSDSQPHHQHK